MKVTNKLILAYGAINATNALKLQAQSEATLESGVTVETESGVEALSESFLLAEARSEANMVAQEEAQLKSEDKITEQETHKFLEVVNSTDKQTLAQEETGKPIKLAQKQPDYLEHTRYGEGNHPSTNEKPIPDHFVQPLVITNGKDEHDFKMPYNDMRPPKVYVPGMDILTQKKTAPALSQKQPDYLEHTRYGEGNHPSTNEKPIPDHFVLPLVITNAKDEHDFKMPYKDMRPPKVYVPGMDIIAQKGSKGQKSANGLNGNLAQTQPDYLEHTRYGEGNHPSTNEDGGALPKVLNPPLTITNQKDEHDFKIPYTGYVAGTRAQVESGPFGNQDPVKKVAAAPKVVAAPKAAAQAPNQVTSPAKVAVSAAKAVVDAAKVVDPAAIAKKINAVGTNKAPSPVVKASIAAPVAKPAIAAAKPTPAPATTAPLSVVDIDAERRKKGKKSADKPGTKQEKAIAKIEKQAAKQAKKDQEKEDKKLTKQEEKNAKIDEKVGAAKSKLDGKDSDKAEIKEKIKDAKKKEAKEQMKEAKKSAVKAAPMTKEEKNELRNAKNKAEKGADRPSADDKADAKADEAQAEQKRSKNDPAPPTKEELKAIKKDDEAKEREMAKNKEEAPEIEKQLEAFHKQMDVTKRVIKKTDKKMEKARKEVTRPPMPAIDAKLKELEEIEKEKKKLPESRLKEKVEKEAKEAKEEASPSLHQAVSLDAEKKVVVKEESFGMKVKSFFKTYLGISF